MLAIKQSPYLRIDLPTSPGKILLARAFNHWCAIHSGSSPQEVVEALSTKEHMAVDTRNDIEWAAHLIGELLAGGQLRSFARPIGGGIPISVPAVHWELDDVRTRFALSALDPNQPYRCDVEPTHWIFFALDEFNALVEQSIGCEANAEIDSSACAIAPILQQKPVEVVQGPMDRFLRLPEIRKLTGMSRSTIYRRIAEDRFPSQIQLDGNIVVWREQDVAQWLASPR